MKSILEINDLHVSFRTDRGIVRAVRGISLELAKGEILAIVGESGCGKSVTSKAILGLLPDNGRIDSGSIVYAGRELVELSERELMRIRGREIALILQDPFTSLNPVLKIGKQLKEAVKQGDNQSKNTEELSRELLEKVGISDSQRVLSQYPFQLSGGMRQRVSIAMALGMSPKVLICDEPTTALDAVVQLRILSLLKDIRDRENLSMMFITHDMGVVAAIAERVCVMYAGKIAEVGRTDEILNSPAHPYTKALLASIPSGSADRQGRLHSISGAPPDMVNVPSGDAFHPRNPEALKIDARLEPPFFKLSDTHYAASWTLHPKAKNNGGNI